jgi:hypothetical protein
MILNTLFVIELLSRLLHDFYINPRVFDVQRTFNSIVTSPKYSCHVDSAEGTEKGELDKDCELVDVIRRYKNMSGNILNKMGSQEYVLNALYYPMQSLH